MNNGKRITYAILLIFIIFAMSTENVFGARKIISKSVTDNFSIWSAYHYTYRFNSSAVLTYDGSNITQISDLAFSNVSYTTEPVSLTASFTPRQKSKYIASDKKSAKYVVTVTRNVYGYYTDKVDYSLTYKPSDAGSPYSLGGGSDIDFEVEIEVGQPYDIQLLT